MNAHHLSIRTTTYDADTYRSHITCTALVTSETAILRQTQE